MSVIFFLISNRIYCQFFIKTEIGRYTQAGAAGDLRQLAINKAGKNFTKRLNACVKAGGGHFEFSQSWQTVYYVVRLKMFISAAYNMVRFLFFTQSDACERQK